MCGRMGLTRRDLVELVDELDAAVSDAVRVEYRPRYNVAPTDRHPVLRIEDGARRLEMLRWGFTSGGRSLLINARADTAAFKPAFRDAYARRRCVVPAD